MRDDFAEKIKDVLAKRVAFYCSNPECRMLTLGPNLSGDGTVNIGVAAHITAASKGGPRYEESLSVDQRRALENGVWLCQSCAKLIDSDVNKYTVGLLNRWKKDAEMNAAKFLNNQFLSSKLFSEDKDFEAIKENGFYEKEFCGQKVRYYLHGTYLHVEHEG